MFHRVLIANRGEIAWRIARSCRDLGLQTVVAYSEADRGAPWLEQADQTVCVGPARAELSYLDQDAILQAAEQTDCQAIHPGYGFLAENPRFAARCEQQGIVFVGPGAEAIRRMGNKVEARHTMARAGLPIIPGSPGRVAHPAAAAAVAAAIGYPVLLTAAAGGGGRGMRRCDDEAALVRGFAEAEAEADKAFADPTLYLEKWIAGGRHVEFQVLADAFGGAIHLGERECSIQRKHQKLVEEAPSPVIDLGVREAMGARVARAVAAFGYRSAGTVEFLRAPDGELFFMEMNTRLQVEHAVTEMLTGVDLVAEQLRLAANQPLRLRQGEVRLSGHAIEFRINAEDPQAGFRPDPGVIRSFEPPRASLDGVHVRWDSAVRAGYRIPPHYDSLIGKLIVHAADRRTAMAGARQALDSLQVSGVQTTLALHRRLIEDAGFLEGRYDVNYLERGDLLVTR